MKSAILAFLCLISNPAFAQECRFLFEGIINETGTTEVEVGDDSEGAKTSSSTVSSFLRRQRLFGRRNLRGLSLSHAETPIVSVASSSRKEPLANSFYASFQRTTNLEIKFDYDLEWAREPFKNAGFVAEYVTPSRKQYSFLMDNGRGDRMVLSKLAAVFASAYRTEGRIQKVYTDYELAGWLSQSATKALGKKAHRTRILALDDIENGLKMITPPSPESAEDFYAMQKYNYREFERLRKSGESHRAAQYAVLTVGGIDILSAMIGRENLFGLYFDVLADLRARAIGERFESPRLRIFSEEQMKDLSKHYLIKKILGELALNRSPEPNLEIVIAFGTKYLFSDLSPINSKALRDYNHGKERAKDFIPDSVFATLLNDGYAVDDFRVVLRDLLWKKYYKFSEGFITFSDRYIYDHKRSSDLVSYLPSFYIR